jgi:hypothetical protein
MPPKRPTVVQPATPNGRKAPVAPPVYRPQPVPKVLQRKTANESKAQTQVTKTREVKAPPVFRPQPAPRVLQPKARKPLGRPASGVVQAMKTHKQAPEDPTPKKKVKVEKLENHIRQIIELIYNRLDTENQRVLPLSVLVTTKLSNMIAEEHQSTKRNWQFISVATKSADVTELVEASNNMQPFNKQTVETAISTNTMPGIKIEQQDKDHFRTGGRQFHAETNLVFHGCKTVGVSGGKNCIFCSLYFHMKGRPYSYHTGAIKSWFLPENATIKDFFGEAVDNYVTKNKSKILSYQNCPSSVKSLDTAQNLIDLLTNTTSFW